MKNRQEAIIVAPYGDHTGFIRALTPSWSRRFGVHRHVVSAGTKDGAAGYERNWNRFANLVTGFGHVSIVGVSYGGTFADRALLEMPEIVDRVVDVSSPHRITDMDLAIIRDKYEALEPSLNAYSSDDLPTTRMQTWRGLTDGTINPNATLLPGADNRLVEANGHVCSIAATLVWHAVDITHFLQQGRP